MLKTLLHILSFCLIGCYFSGSKNDAKIRISSSLISPNDIPVHISVGAMLYLINKDQGTQRAVKLDGSQITFEIDNGNWDFAVLAWDGATPISGTLNCAKGSLNISNLNSEIHLTLSAILVMMIFFSPSNLLSISETNTLRIISCQDVSTASVGSNCDGTNDR